MKCNKCGYENAESNNFCEGCGIALKVLDKKVPPKRDEEGMKQKINDYNLNKKKIETFKELLSEFLETYALDENERASLKTIVAVAHEISDDGVNFNGMLGEIFGKQQKNRDNQSSKRIHGDIDKEKILIEPLVIPEKNCETIGMEVSRECVEEEQPIISQPVRQKEPIIEDEIVEPQNEDLTLTECVAAEIVNHKFSNSQTQNNNYPVFHPVKVEGEMVDIPVTKTPFIIGRGPKNVDFILKATGISRSHCLVAFHNESYYISDMGSTNKVFLNNRMLKPGIEYQVKNGDTVNFGTNQYCFEVNR